MRNSLLLLTLLLCQSSYLLFAQSNHSWQSFVKPDKVNAQLELENEILIATDAGIAVFDKESEQIVDHWTRTSHGLPSNKIEAILQDPLTQQLIIGTYDLGVFRTVENENEEWGKIEFPEELINENGLNLTYCMAFDDQGRLCVGTNVGLLILEGDQWLHYGPNDFDNFLHGVWDMVTAQDGTLYVGSNIILKLKDGLLTPHTAVPLSSMSFDSILFAYGDRHLYMLPNGDLWSINDLGQSMRYSAEGEWTFFDGYTQAGDPHFNLYDRHFVWDNTFYAETGGLYLIYNDYGWDTVPAPYDQEGVAHVMMLNNELYGSFGNQFLSLNPDGNTILGQFGNWPFENNRLNSIVDQVNGTCWVRDGNRTMENLTTGDRITLPVIDDINYFNRVVVATDGSNDIWLQANEQLFLWQNQETIVSYPYADGAGGGNSHFIREVVFTGNGQPWFRNSNHEVFTLINNQWHLQYNGQPIGSIYSLVPIGENEVAAFYWSAGNLEAIRIGLANTVELELPSFISSEYLNTPLAGTSQDLWLINRMTNEVARLHNGTWTQNTLPEELVLSESIRFFHANGPDDIVLVTANSIALLNEGTWVSYNFGNAPIDTDFIHSVAMDENGNIYMLHSFGPRQVLDKLDRNMISSLEPGVSPTQFDLEVYPNPTTDYLSFENPFQSTIYSIYDQNGRMLLSGLSKARNPRLSVTHLPAGNYILSLEGEEQRILAKIIVN